MYCTSIIFLLTVLLSFGIHFQIHAINSFYWKDFNRAKDTTTPARGIVFKQREILNRDTGTVLEWEVDRQRTPNSTIAFTFATEIGILNESPSVTIILGLSVTGQVYGSDVAAVTISRDTPAQVVDMYGIDNVTIVPDYLQNWILVSSQRNDSHVTFTVSRVLNTCDEQDVVINNDLLRVIWGITRPSTTEDGSLTFSPEGSVRAYLLDPVGPSPEESDMIQSWRISRTFRLPVRRTSYWCTIHRGLELTSKHNIVGYTPYFKDAVSEQFVHHQFIYRCTIPPDFDATTIYERFVGHPGEECFLEQNPQLPTSFCKKVIAAWAIGGKPFYFPNDLGIALGEFRNEYFMLETHYNNPELLSDVVVENGLELLYTPKLRPLDGSIIFVSHGILGLFQVPPRAPGFRVAGHCSDECTRLMFPKSGVQIEAAILHSHVTGRQITLRHFRGNRELPWIQTEGNYDFNYQQMRLISPPVSVLPGDQLIVECMLDTSSRNATTLSGFSTFDEMCTAFMVLNKRTPYTFCSSEYPVERTMARYGITNFTWNLEGQDQERVVNAANNPNWVGRPLTTVIDKTVGPWNAQKVRELEWEQLYEDQESSCPPLQDVLQLGNSLQYLENVTKGFIPTRFIVESFITTSRSIRTSIVPGFRFVRYPRRSAIYTPPQTCGAKEYALN